MLELLKNKMVISFMIFVVTIIYFDSVNVRKMEELEKNNENIQITINDY